MLADVSNQIGSVPNLLMIAVPNLLVIFRTSLGASHLVLADVSNHIGSHFAQASRRESYLQAISWYEA